MKCGSFTIMILFYTQYVNGLKKDAQIEKIPFIIKPHSRAIYARTQIDQERNFFKLFNVPYIICFFAANGKWPFIPPLMKVQVDQVSRSIFVKDDGYIQNYCRGKFSFQQTFRPTYYVTPGPIVAPTTICACAAALKAEPTPPMVYFNKDHIGDVSAEVIENTIEFLKGFLPTEATQLPITKRKKKKQKIHVINIEH